MKQLLLILLIPTMLWGQEEESSRSLQFSHIGVSVGSGMVEDSENTLYGSLEIGVHVQHHFFKASFISGGPTRTFWDTEPYGNFIEVNALYGREFELQSWLLLDAYAGIGYFSFGEKNPDGSRYTLDKNSVGFPIEGTLSTPIWKWLRLGFRAHHNFNAFRNVTTVGGVLNFYF